MKFVFSAALVISVAVFLVAKASAQNTNIQDNIATGGGCFKTGTTENCTKTATLKVTTNGICTVSEYHKETISSTVGISVSPLNGIAQCTKTPCDAAEKIPTDCETAFGVRLSEVEK